MTPLHSTELFKIFFSLLTLSTAFLQKASGPGKKFKKKDSRMHKQREIQKTGLSISIASEPIKEVTEAKFLGVWFDPMLIWDVHIRNIRNELVSSIAIIKRILPFIPKTNHKSIYYTLFEFHLAYCISM